MPVRFDIPFATPALHWYQTQLEGMTANTKGGGAACGEVVRNCARDWLTRHDLTVPDRENAAQTCSVSESAHYPHGFESGGRGCGSFRSSGRQSRDGLREASDACRTSRVCRTAEDRNFVDNDWSLDAESRQDPSNQDFRRQSSDWPNGAGFSSRSCRTGCGQRESSDQHALPHSQPLTDHRVRVSASEVRLPAGHFARHADATRQADGTTSKEKGVETLDEMIQRSRAEALRMHTRRSAENLALPVASDDVEALRRRATSDRDVNHHNHDRWHGQSISSDVVHNTHLADDDTARSMTRNGGRLESGGVSSVRKAGEGVFVLPKKGRAGEVRKDGKKSIRDKPTRRLSFVV